MNDTDTLLTLFTLPEPVPLALVASKMRRLLIYDRATFGRYTIDRVADGRVSVYLVYRGGMLYTLFNDSQFSELVTFVAWRINSVRDIRVQEGAAYSNKTKIITAAA